MLSRVPQVEITDSLHKFTNREYTEFAVTTKPWRPEGKASLAMQDPKSQLTFPLPNYFPSIPTPLSQLKQEESQ